MGQNQPWAIALIIVHVNVTQTNFHRQASFWNQKVAKSHPDKFARQRSKKEYPRTKSADAKNLVCKRGLHGGEIYTSNEIVHKGHWAVGLYWPQLRETKKERKLVYTFPFSIACERRRFFLRSASLHLKSNTMSYVTQTVLQLRIADVTLRVREATGGNTSALADYVESGMGFSKEFLT